MKRAPRRHRLFRLAIVPLILSLSSCCEEPAELTYPEAVQYLGQERSTLQRLTVLRSIAEKKLAMERRRPEFRADPTLLQSAQSERDDRVGELNVQIATERQRVQEAEQIVARLRR